MSPGFIGANPNIDVRRLWRLAWAQPAAMLGFA